MVTGTSTNAAPAGTTAGLAGKEMSPGPAASPVTWKGTVTSSPETASSSRRTLKEPSLSLTTVRKSESWTTGIGSSSETVSTCSVTAPGSAPVRAPRVSTSSSSPSKSESSRIVTSNCPAVAPAGITRGLGVTSTSTPPAVALPESRTGMVTSAVPATSRATPTETRPAASEALEVGCAKVTMGTTSLSVIVRT